MKTMKERLRKPMYVVLALMMAAVVGISATVAYFVDQEEAVNQIKIGGVQIHADETVDGLEKTDIGVQSSGTSKSYVRMIVNVPIVSYSYVEDGASKEGAAGIYLYEENASAITVDEDAVSASQWTFYPDGQEIPAVILPKGSVEGGMAGTQFRLAHWQKQGDYWYLSDPLNPGETARIIGRITYPGLMVAGSLRLPTGLSESMLTVTVSSEAVQAGDGEIKDAQGNSLTGAAAAVRAFEQMTGS